MPGNEATVPRGAAPGNGTPNVAMTARKAAAGADDASLEQVERETIIRTLAAASGNKSEAARRLGITRRTLHQKLKKYGMM